MITVVIPALNEAAHIAAVVTLARHSPGVEEVIVVDDGSVDETVDRATAAGARVITSTLLGKGTSMADGVAAASQETVVFLDGDLSGLRADVVSRLARPVYRGEAEFVKARFARAGGRVTALTARPLLDAFFPELGDIEQPLGGLVAARRSLLQRLAFETDYGVDVGLLIDAWAAGARIAEVDIGALSHEPQALEALGGMAMQVTRVILDRAARQGRLRRDVLDDALDRRMQLESHAEHLLRRIGHPARLALLDMDGVLLDGRFVTALAREARREGSLLAHLDDGSLQPDERTRRIAAAMHGIPRETFVQVARTMPLMDGATDAVIALRRAGYRVGIVTDSVCVAAETVRRRVFADFSVAHRMAFRQGRATGELAFSPLMAHARGCVRHRHCKLNVLLHVAERIGLRREEVLAIGDGENDICLLEAAGRSIAFEPKSALVALAAGHVAHRSLHQAVARVA